MRGRYSTLIGALTATAVAALLATVSVGAAPAANITRTPVLASHRYGAHIAKHKKKHKKKPAANTNHPLCSSIVSLGAIQAATGLAGTALVSTHAFTAEYELWDVQVATHTGDLPGSDCAYSDPDPGTSEGQEEGQVNDIDYVAVGYGESEKNWKAFEARYTAAGGGPPEAIAVPTSGLDGNAPVSPLTLGSGSQAFLMTGNLVAAGDAEYGATFPNPGPNFPTVYYIVTVMTKNDNVLQVGLYSSRGTTAAAALSADEALVKNVLTTEPKF
jgi:hypothetical protein